MMMYVYSSLPSNVDSFIVIDVTENVTCKNRRSVVDLEFIISDSFLWRFTVHILTVIYEMENYGKQSSFPGFVVHMFLG